MPGKAASIIKKISSNDFMVAIIGMGYVGLPLAYGFAKSGLKVVGVEVDKEQCALLKQGQHAFEHLTWDDFPALVKSRKLSFVNSIASLTDVDAYIICVPTPLGAHQEPDLSAVLNVAKSIGKRLKPSQLVVLESTTYPGTTEDLLQQELTATNDLVAGRDFFLAFSPEREDPGNKEHANQDVPKIVGGVGGDSLAIAQALYKRFFKTVVPVSSPKIAEMAKLLENIFRSVNIALVNELKVFTDKMGFDVWEAIDAASTKPFGYMPFYPGPGLGGHCIPLDPFYLTWKAREYGFNMRFIELAGEINRAMPAYVCDRMVGALVGQGMVVKGARVLLLGIAYKKGIGDMRESPALAIINECQRRELKLGYYDAHVSRDALKGRSVKRHANLDEKVLVQYDVVLIITDHSDVDYQMIIDHAKLIVDTRHATYGLKSKRGQVVWA